MSKHGFLAVIMLRVVDVEAEIIVAPSSKGARGFAQVLLGVVANAHGEQFHELAAKILVRSAFQILSSVQINEHRRIARDSGKQSAEISGRVLLEQCDLAEHLSIIAHLLLAGREVTMPE